MKPDESAFVARYGGVYERSPWVAEDAEALVGIDDPVERIAEVMAACVDNAPLERQLELIRAHPDLAGKVQLTGGLTADSAREQASAGLDRCSAAEFERFQRLNRAYREKFGFPFVMAVRDRTREEVLDAFEKRLGQGTEDEFRSALSEIHKIARQVGS